MAYSMKRDVVVLDENCREFSKELKRLGFEFELRFASYCASLERVKRSGIKLGRVATNLGIFQEDLSKQKGKVGSVSENVEREAKSFLEKVDKADSYLF